MIRGSRKTSRPCGILALAAVCLSAGCVERRYIIRTDPPGALVSVDGEDVGISPVSVSYEYYKDRDVTIEAEGYETLRTVMPLPAPWWDNILTEFVSENLIPYTLRDDRTFEYRLAPATTPPTGELVERGEQLRRASQAPPPKPPPPWVRFFAF